jgi:alkylation response protein AidB-like acyl-CoA dehydrogenase
MPDHPNAAAIEEIRDSARRFVAQRSNPPRVRALRGQRPGYARDIWRAMGEAGWFGVLVAEDDGGLGLGLPEAAAIAETLAEGVFPEPFLACAVLPSLLLGGHAALDQVLSSERVVAVAWQENGLDHDPAGCATLAADRGNGVVLSGVKRFVIGGDDADGFIVSARTPADVSLWFVPADAPGVSVVAEPLVDGTFAAELRLDSVIVPAEDRVGDGAALAGALDRVTILASAELLALSRAAFDMTLEHLRTRRQFDRPIGAFQALRHRAVDMGSELELARGVLADALATTDPAALGPMASRVKARCGEAGWLIARESIQMFGAMGFTDELDLTLYVKRIMALSAWLGSAAAHRRRFAAIAPPTEDAGQRGGVAAGLRDLPRDADWNALSDGDFRALVRDFFEREYPDEFRHLPRRVRWQEVRGFNMKLAERGWIAPAWPRSAGGMALSPAKQIVYAEELERAGVGRAPDQGVRQVGPVLMRYGSEAQKAYYLPRILSCEHIWCQGYSEPGAGSDLAAVTTRAERDGDWFVINGQKIWTSLAMDSTHIYILCRTDPNRPKQRGLSFIIAPMDTPGITWRPIRNIAGDEEFCQVFLDDVRVPAENLVGALNEGWTVAKAVLGFERLGTGSPNRPLLALNRLTALARAAGLFADPGFVDDFTRLRMRLLDHATLYGTYAQAVGRGELLGHEVSYLKVIGMEAMQRVTEFALERAGMFGALGGTFELDGRSIDLLAPFHLARMTTIGAGTSEINRDILAKRVLALPDR